MDERDPADAVWAETSSGGMLRDLFGASPTLHDARVRQIRFESETKRLEMLVDYEDEGEDLPPFRVLIRLIWSGVRRASFSHYENWLYGVGFRMLPEGGMRTDFDQGIGLHGFVEADDFEATMEQASPKDLADHEEGRMDIELS